MAFSSFNAQPERTQTPPFPSFFRLEPALPHTHAQVPYWTLEVWLLTGFNFLNRRPPTRSIAGTYGLIQFQCSTQTDPNSTIFVIFSVRTCAAPHTRACTLLDPGGLVSHGFQLSEQKTSYSIDSRYLWPSPVSMRNPNIPKHHHFRLFFRLEPALPHTHAHVPHRTTEV